MSEKEHFKSLFWVLSFALLGATAFQLGYKLVMTSHTNEREPAAIPRIYDYSHLEGEALQRASKDRLIGAAKIIHVGDAEGLELGHFVTKNKDGQNVGACEIYDKVEMTFFAGGMAVSGDSPTMTVSGPCVPADNINVISPLMIPYSKILNLPVKDQEINDSEESGSGVSVSFKNVSDSWPQLWILQTVKLTNSSEFPEVTADEKDIRRVLGKAPALEWPQ
jgi:hypothetical protein